MLWIKEVEMVASLEVLKSSRSIDGKNFPNFEMLDAKIASVLNKIIQNYQFKKKVCLEEQTAQKEDRFLRGRQIAFMISDYFRVTGAHTVLDYADLFSVTLHVDVTCLNCFRQTHFASAVGHELVDPKTSNAFFHGEGFHVNSSQTHFNPVVNFEEIRVFSSVHL